jgi:TonB family protein
MKIVKLFSLIILGTSFLSPILIYTQNPLEHSDQELLGLTEDSIEDQLLLSDEIGEEREVKATEGEPTLRIEYLCNKALLNDAERIELFELQTSELQNQLKMYLGQRIEYPGEMKDYHIEGTVMVEAAFTNDGRVISSKVLKGLHTSCDRASLEALEGFRYNRSAYRGAKRIIIPVAFILD